MDSLPHTFPHLIIMLSIIHVEVVYQILICLPPTFYFLLIGAGITTSVSFFEILKKKKINYWHISEDFVPSLKHFSLSFPDTALLAISHQPNSSFLISFASVATISSRPLDIPQAQSQTLFLFSYLPTLPK